MVEIKIIGKENGCEHNLKAVDGNVKWCTKCGMLQVDVYDVGYVMLRREHHYPGKEYNKKEK